MANMRKLSTFRQLSLTCDSPTIDQRRKSLKKQFSEDFCDVKEKFGAKTRDRPHPIRIAWADDSIVSPKEEGLIAKKCIKEVKKPPKLIRHSSLEKESILYSKQDLADRLRQALKEREQEKPNLNIFLAHNTTMEEDYETQEPEIITKETPKIIPPLLTPLENTMKNVFQIRKNKEMPYTPSKPNAVVVIPIVEKDQSQLFEDLNSPPSSDRSFNKQDPKAIKNVIIRPATAAAKRERFQKRNNTAFNSVIKEGVRPPLVRSSSAPSKPEQVKPKFFATKRKIKSGKVRGPKTPTSEDEDCADNKENPKNKKEMNRYVPVNGNDIVTMVSLISPAASDTEEVEVEIKPKTKSSPSKESISKKEEKEVIKNMSLRKTVKSVSFQSSTIHAIRSFSASFPARRGSMATALILGNAMKSQKNQEKRATNSVVPDDEERGPKRRLVRSAINKSQKSSEDETQSKVPEEKQENNDPSITVAIKEKTCEDETVPETKTNTVLDSVDETKDKTESDDSEPKFGSAKEKECWDMYCKMADKGLKVSYDTILRGMLTPTEYRMRRKESIVPTNEETNSQ